MAIDEFNLLRLIMSLWSFLLRFLMVYLEQYWLGFFDKFSSYEIKYCHKIAYWQTWNSTQLRIVFSAAED